MKMSAAPTVERRLDIVVRFEHGLVARADLRGELQLTRRTTAEK